MKRVFLIVLDSLGIGAAPDAEKTVDKTWEIMKKAVSEDDE